MPDQLPTTPLQFLRRITSEMTEFRDLPEVLRSISRLLTQHAGFRQSLIYLYLEDRECPYCVADHHRYPPGERALHRWAEGAETPQSGDPRLHRIRLGVYLVGRVAQTREPMVVNDFAGLYRRYAENPESVQEMEGDPEEDPGMIQRLSAISIDGAAIFPLIVRDELVGVLGCYSDKAIDPSVVEILEIFAHQAATAIKTAELFEAVDRTNSALASENAYLRAEVRDETGFGAVVGGSRAMRRVLRAGRQVASTDSTVLLLGETGTGKEVIARAVHDLSSRRDRPLIKVNCGAIAGTLAESEIFGHERGAFTGAVQRRLGRFELADGGTLFMDEVGELSLDLQVKLLRVLQEREFERLGGSQLVRVDVRLIAATNRDLTEEVRAGRFRADLYYRLNVFPIRVPPLRDRREDIRPLADHFLALIGRQLGKHFKGFAPECLRQFEEYDWPGNVRELHNVVERLSVLAHGPVLELTEPLRPHAPAAASGFETLEAMERGYLERVLTAHKWRIEGQEGAARVLGLAPSTLRARMNRLGVVRPA